MNGNDIVDYFLGFVDVYISFEIIKFLHIRWAKIKHRKDKIILYPYQSWKNVFNLRNNKRLVILVPATISLFIFNFFTFLTLFICVSFSSFLIFNSPEIDNVLLSNNLNLGYGAALCYYKNYLSFNIPHKFIERVEEFRTRQQVDVQLKLYILVPRSCKVLKYIDSDSDSEFIERCRELKEFNETHAGFKDRVYTITVYHLRKQGVRLAVEYAQPLKALFALKEKNLISKEEMFQQRDLFIQSLREFLKDENDSHKFCELIDYDDEEKKAFEVLLERCSGC